MKSILLRSAPIAALLLLAACDTQPTTIVAGGPADPDADKIKAAKPVKLPPAVLANKSYRCKDNSLIWVDWFNDSLTANLHVKDKTATPVNLTSTTPGGPFSGGGYELSGTPDAKAVTLKKGGSSQSCDA